MANLYLFKYNSYYNKIIKREENIEGYGEALNVTERVNFNPADGVRTVHIINAGVDISGADYCVVTTDSGAIESRWYIMEKDRTRGGQYRLQLLRDVIAEYKEEFLSATCFMEKGWVHQSNPLIFNNEGMGFNQIKTREILLSNNIKSPWLIIYLSRYNNDGGSSGELKFNSFEGNYKSTFSGEPDYILENLEDYEYYGLTHRVSPNQYMAQNTLYFGAEYKQTPSLGSKLPIKLMTVNLGRFSTFTPDSTFPPYPLPATSESRPAVLQPQNISVGAGWIGIKSAYISGNFTDSDGIERNSYTGYITPEYFQKVIEENGKLIQVGNDYYRVFVNQPSEPIDQIRKEIPANSNLGQTLKREFFTDNNIIIPEGVTEKYWIYGTPSPTGIEVGLELIQGQDGMNTNYKYQITYDKPVTKDANYEIIASPLYDGIFTLPDGTQMHHVGELALEWFQNIINKYNGAGNAYDLQLVPYSPIDSFELENEELVYLENTEDVKISLGIKLRKSSFSGFINTISIPIREDLKESNELDLYRIISPGGVGEYQWSPAKNGGDVSQFEYDCTLIPFNPYIKINPIFSNLYGGDYNDYRGLICGGDFSLSIVNSAWETYQLQNKYYQDIFNRQIEHLEFNNNQAHIREGVSFMNGLLGSVAQGAQIGMAGGSVGSAAGAIAGGASALAGGIIDLIMNEQSRTENLNYQKDNFNFQLGTIKARAQSLTRTTSYNINNKYFPYVEYYTCTETEVQAYRNKIKYSGMTLGVIGSPQNYINPAPGELTFVRGALIEINIPDDLQLIMEIRKRLEGGIRLNGS